ncbi:putative mitochondrial-processing peptidase subunit alpha-1, mitochondrial [Porphyridium purpureum]|uniref:Putative mitochondrial-processing peptidase subunit alpha-1, mitochondrial n=1 Tax=Porphyridium purpureum TaxID=35688 RepID=A0A5J4Z8R0_PORPP|nr:putative mitochondrial-processing peptidase subunit alpha-1, mitochondrial [Porphyridium purpureum]|eukprot:POR5406..scf295_1
MAGLRRVFGVGRCEWGASRVMGCGRVAARSATGVSIRPMSSLWKLTHGSFDFETDMHTEMAGIARPDSERAKVRIGAEGMRVSRLANGAKVCSFELQGTDACVALGVRAGTRWTNAVSGGIPHIMSAMAFLGSKDLSKVRAVRSLENMGVRTHSHVERENILYSLNSQRSASSLLDGTRMMIESALNPLFMHALDEPGASDSIRAYANQLAQFFLDRRHVSPADAVIDSLHAVAYGDFALGVPLYADARQLMTAADNLDHLLEYRNAWISGPRLALVGVNVPHEELESCAKESALVGAPSADSSVSEPSRWVGGSRKVSSGAGASVAFGFDVEVLASSKAKPADIAPVLVLQALINSGKAGALASSVCGASDSLLNDGVTTSAHLGSYADAGIFSMVAQSRSASNTNALVSGMGSAVRALSLPSSETIEATKKRVACSLYSSRESSTTVAREAASLLAAGVPFTATNELVSAVKAVTAPQLEGLVGYLKSQTFPAIAVHGETFNSITYDEAKALLVA